MSQRRDRGDEPTLFDLPLESPAERAGRHETDPETDPDARPEEPRPEARERHPPDRGPGERPEAPESPSGPDEPIGPEPGEASRFSEAAEPGRETRPRRPRSVLPPFSVRLLAGLADLAIHTALAIALLFGARLLGAPAGLGDWPPILLFLAVFSFLYSVLPLAFWGQTPGMAWAGVVSRDAEGEGLTLGQTVRRWLGGLATVALLGLPLLLALRDGRTLADRVSDSRTLLS